MYSELHKSSNLLEKNIIDLLSIGIYISIHYIN